MIILNRISDQYLLIQCQARQACNVPNILQSEIMLMLMQNTAHCNTNRDYYNYNNIAVIIVVGRTTTTEERLVVFVSLPDELLNLDYNKLGTM